MFRSLSNIRVGPQSCLFKLSERLTGASSTLPRSLCAPVDKHACMQIEALRIYARKPVMLS